MGRYTIYAVITVLCLIAVSGCMSHHTERVSDVNPLGWRNDDTVRVVYPNTDTLALRKISVIVRFNDSFDGDILKTVIRTVSPDSISYAEEISLPLQYMGIKYNDHFEAVVPYRENSILKKQGPYTFEFIPVGTYVGVTAVGIKSD